MQVRSERRAALGLVVALFAYEIARTQLPEGARLPLNLAVAGLAVAWARYRGFTRTELGIDGGRAVRRGLAWGLGTMGLVAFGVLAGGTIPAVRDALRPDEAVTAATAAYKVLVNIPFQTVVLEEVVFRGVLLAVLVRVLPGTCVAVLASSALFGLWHVAPTIENASGGASVGAVAVAVGVTFLAGLFFAVLRLASGSVLAPALVHLATNAFPYLVGYYLLALQPLSS